MVTAYFVFLIVLVILCIIFTCVAVLGECAYDYFIGPIAIIVGITAFVILTVSFCNVHEFNLSKYEYDIDKIRSENMVITHYKEDVSSPYMKYKETIFGIHQYDYYLPKERKFDKYRLDYSVSDTDTTRSDE